MIALEVALRLAALLAGGGVESRRDDAALLRDADVAVYGDSTPFGYGAATSFPAELARATGARVVNRARPAINSFQTASILERDLAHGTPRLLVVMTGVNDSWSVADVDPALLGPLAPWLEGLPELRVARLFRILFTAIPGPDDDLPERPDRGAWSARAETASALGRDGVARITATGLERIARLARQRGIEILFLGYQAPGWNRSADLVEEILAREYGDRFLPMRDLFPTSDLLLADAFHPTDEGHRRIAARLQSELARRGWLVAPALPHALESAPESRSALDRPREGRG